MKKTIDARGKICPIPVVETKKRLKTLSQGDTLEVQVDNFVAVQNLSKMAQQKKLLLDTKKIDENNYIVTFTKNINDDIVKVKEDVVGVDHSRPDKTVVVLASDRMGQGDERLGRILMKGFIYALTEQEQLPDTILLYNRGCYLSTQDSDSVADLQLLESQGVEILTCGTCLNHYGLDKKLSVGEATNMYVLVEKQVQASKIIKP